MHSFSLVLHWHENHTIYWNHIYECTHEEHNMQPALAEDVVNKLAPPALYLFT